MESEWENLEESVKRTVIAVKDFAKEREKVLQDVIALGSSELASFLKEFYLALKDRTDDETSSVSFSNLQGVRSDLADYFKKVMDIDIENGTEFAECNAVVNDTKGIHLEIGNKNVIKKHTRQRTFTFDTNELRQIYMSDAMNLNQPETLQNKVFFDICMYICNRGKDFLRLMTKNDFEVSTDQDGRRYIWLKYNPKFSYNEVTDNMTSDGSHISQIGDCMYERQGDPKCPVLSYMQYVIHLHPMSDAFWQRPKRSISSTDFVWYDNQSIGNSTLNKFMNRITQSAGLPDSYAINAIKSSYIPIIESICCSTLLGNQQFCSMLNIKQTNNPDTHCVRKRFSEGSLSIPNKLREGPMFRPRHSEPQLPVYQLENSEAELMRSDSASPINRDNSCPSRMLLAHNIADRLNSTEHMGQEYMNFESGPSSTACLHNYRSYGSVNGQDVANNEMCACQVHEEKQKKVECSNILQAKQKCLDIIQSLDVPDLKSFITWMQTFAVKYGPSGLMVTCQPVNGTELPSATQSKDVNVIHESMKEKIHFNENLQNSKNFRNFDANGIKFDCVCDTFCSTSDFSPVKITIPAQDTVLLMGIEEDFQVLIHKNNTEDNKRIDHKCLPLHMRVFTSNDDFSLQNIHSVLLRKGSHDRDHCDNNHLCNMQRSSCFKEEKSIPMKKRSVINQGDQSQSISVSDTSQLFSLSQSSPLFSQHSATLAYRTQQICVTSSIPVTAHSSGHQSMSVHTTTLSSSMAQDQLNAHTTEQNPKYYERFADGWSYIPLQKRQRFGMQESNNSDEVPLDLIKQT